MTTPAGAAAAVVPADASRGVLVALGIALLWLAGLAFFFAFEGSTLLAGTADTTGGGILRGLVGALAEKTVAAEKQGV